MPSLDRANITIASRIMLPAYIVVCVIFGTVYVFDPRHRLARAPSLTFQRSLMPAWVWGTVLLGVAAVMFVAFLKHSRMTFSYGLSLCAVTWFLWGCTIVPSIFVTNNTTFLAPVLPWFVCVCSIASLASLLSREV